MKKPLIWIWALFFVGILSAQETEVAAKQYTMQDAVVGIYLNLAPERVEQTAWIPNENAFTKVDYTKRNPEFVRVEVPSMKEETLFKLSDLNEQLFKKEPIRRFPGLQWMDENHLYFNFQDVIYKISRKGNTWNFKKWIDLPEGTDNIYVDSKNQQIAFSADHNLHYADRDGKIQKVTDESDSNIVSGQVVSRNEFGIESGVYFSPKGNLLAFYQKDESKVKDYPIIDWSVTPAENNSIKYPMAGGESELVTVKIYNPKTQETVEILADKAEDDYLTNVSWSPDENSLFVGVFKRSQKHLVLNQYDAKTGKKIRQILEEKDDKYVHPADPLYFIPGKDDEFIWTSERSGFMHLYRYNTKGKLLNQLTSGDWLVNGIEGWNPKKNEVIISATKETALNKNIYAVNWKTGKIRRLDNAEGVHSATVQEDGNYWLDRYSNYNTPNHQLVYDLNKNWEKELVLSKNPLEAYAQPDVRQLQLKAADGKTDLFARMILPPDFDDSKKYPVIVYLYNGPGVQLLQNHFPASGNLWYDYLAQNGYIVFTMDGRGSANRGLTFEQASYRDLGTVEMEDQLKGVDYLKSLAFVDTDRMGVHGWSYGGFMTTSLMLKHPGVFKVGVAGGPVIDWNMYEIMYTERFMDRPQDNPEGYAHTSLLDKTKKLEGKLLIIHGALDDIVVWQHSMKLLRKSVENNKQFDYYVYPAHPHNVRGFDRIHLMQKVTDYFDLYLK